MKSAAKFLNGLPAVILVLLLNSIDSESSMIKTRRALIVGSLNGAPQSLDPAQIIESAQWHTLLNLGMTLVTYDRKGRLVGDAAQSWQVSPDLREFSFTLIDNARDSAGNPLDSSDWRATFLHLLRSGGSTHSFIAEFLDETGIETPSPRQLVLRLKKPYQTFMQRLTTPEFILVPKRAISRSNRINFEISSGAYFLKGFDRSKGTCMLRANPYYVHARPGQIRDVVLEPVPPSSAEHVQRFADGKWNFSIISLLPVNNAGNLLTQLVAEKRIHVTNTDPAEVGFVVFFDSPRLTSTDQRLSLARVIGDQAEKDMTGLSATAAHQFYPSGFVGALPPPQVQQLNADIRARARGSLLPKTLRGYGTSASLATGLSPWLVNILRNTGVEVEFHTMSYPDYVSKRKTLDHDFLVVLTGVNAKDPAGSLLTLIGDKGSIIPDHDGHFESLLRKAVQSPPSQRTALLHELSRDLLKDARIVPFVHSGTTILSSHDLIVELPSPSDDEIRLADIRWRE